MAQWIINEKKSFHLMKMLTKWTLDKYQPYPQLEQSQKNGKKNSAGPDEITMFYVSSFNI